MTAITQEQFESLIAAAVAAPSADNRHVFRLEAHADGIRMSATKDFLEATPTRRILGLISFGAAAQNLELRGRKVGLGLEARWLLGSRDERLIADFKCSAAPATDDLLEGAIEARHSNRRLNFGGPGLPQATQHQLAAEAAAVQGTGLVWLDDFVLRKRALRLIRWAETERFRNEELHRELFASIRFDVGWHASAPEGLPAGSLELPWFERPAFSALRYWPVQRAANLLGIHHFIGMRAADLPCRLAPHLCAITATGDIELGAFSAGRLLQRIWLRATVLGFSFQVFAAPTLYALEESTSVRPDLRRKLASGWAHLCPNGRPFLAFRLGHARPPSIRAGRPPSARFRSAAE